MKTFVLLIATTFAAGLVGCGSSEEPVASVPQTQIESPKDEPVADSSAAEIGETEPPGVAEPPRVAEPKPEAPKPKSPEQGALPKLWDFSAEWCPPCREQKPIMHELEGEYEGKVEIKIIDVDQEEDLASKFGIKAIPTQVFLDKDGNELSRHTGLFPKDSLIGRMTTHGFIE